jgi:hypothetical protein
MKKLFFLFIVVLAGTSISSFGQTKKYEILVDGFDGDKPLTEDQAVIVFYPENIEDGYTMDAYKGDTRESFLLRLKTDSIKAANGYFTALIKELNKKDSLDLIEKNSQKDEQKKDSVSISGSNQSDDRLLSNIKVSEIFKSKTTKKTIIVLIVLIVYLFVHSYLNKITKK